MKKEIKVNDANDETEYKLILLGDTSVGKTCLFKKITTGIFIDKNVSTVGIDRRTIPIKCDFDVEGEKITKKVIVNLTDTAGEERFKAITKSYYKGSDGAILLYDITEKKTFEHLKDWIESIKASTSNSDNDKYTIFILGTKIDLVESGKKEREVELEEAENQCKELGLVWGGECSNKEFTEEKFKEIFKEFIKIIYSKIGFKKFVSQSSVKLDINPKKNQNINNCPCIVF
jgi:small GTP-binding protein